MQYNPSDLSINTTICAISTASGSGAIAIIRLSGPKTFEILETVFHPAKANTKIKDLLANTIHFGHIYRSGKLLDEVLVSIFRAPHSYTGEDVIEISCHGSIYIQQEIVELLIDQGAKYADAGEFTMRAFYNGKMDLSQAEAVADLIASNSKASHQLALQQMRGGFSDKIKELRQKLVDFTSLIELELDFSEEDVEFADRTQFRALLNELSSEIARLLESFKLGNVIKRGIPVAIIGKPNVGKSTLLNAILNEEKAIVSEIPGTTRDVIEDTVVINGYSFRFIDTAGLRASEDKIENIGIERAFQQIEQASIILYLCDVSECSQKNIQAILEEFRAFVKDESKRFILIANKIDQLVETPHGVTELFDLETIFISAKRKENLNLIVDSLVRSVKDLNITDQTIVSNARHYEALSKAMENLKNVEKAMNDNIPSDLWTIDIRSTLHYLGEITGEITTDEILGNIFSKFCIGK